MDRLPPLKSLLAFEAVSRWLSVTRAAEELHVTQSAVSQQLRTLEEALGFPLFIRENQGLQLTAKGRLLAPKVRSGFGTISECLAEINQRDRSVSVLVASDGMLTHMMQRLPEFQALHSGLRVWLAPLMNGSQSSMADTDIIIRPIGYRNPSRQIQDRQLKPYECRALNEVGMEILLNVESQVSEAVEEFLIWLDNWYQDDEPTSASAYSFAENGARSSAASPTPIA